MIYLTLYLLHTNSHFIHNIYKRENNLFLYKKMSQQLTDLLSTLNKAEKEVEAIISNSSLEDLANIYLDMFDKDSSLLSTFEKYINFNEEFLIEIINEARGFSIFALTLFDKFKGIKIDSIYFDETKFSSLQLLNRLIKDNIFPFDIEPLHVFLSKRSNMKRYTIIEILKYDQLISIIVKEKIPEWFLEKILWKYKERPNFSTWFKNQLRNIFLHNTYYLKDVIKIMKSQKDPTIFPKLFLDLDLYDYCSFLSIYLGDREIMGKEFFELEYGRYIPVSIDSFFRKDE